MITDTASVHAKAWKETFDALLDALGKTPEFSHADYEAYVDGKSRLDGVRSFLGSRDIDLPEGDPSDEPGAQTVEGIGRAKNDRLLELIRTDGVKGYDDAARLLRAAREQGLATAVVSSSANAREALRSVGLEDCFDTWVDGNRIDAEGIKGKPAPDAFLTAARDLDTAAAEAAVFEDAVAGMQAGRAGSFGWVVGVDRTGHADALRENGADVVVSDLDDVTL